MIKIENVSKVFKGEGKKIEALRNVNLEVEKGDIFGVIGLSGAGKSTLIRTLNLLEKPTSGRILIDGKDIGAFTHKELRQIRKNIGMIFQHFNLLNSKTIFQNIAIPLVLEKKNKQQIKERVLELLEFVGLADKVHNYPYELSGGQKQRIGIARALATSPSILLCDEATSALDPQTTDSVLKLLQKINEQYNITIVMIAHDMNIIKKVCNRVAVMEAGEVIELGDVVNVFQNPIQVSTKKFVDTVIQREIPVSVLRKIDRSKNSKLLKVVYTDEDSSNFVNDIIKQFEVDVRIIYANMDEIKNKQVGYFLIQIIGELKKIEEIIQYTVKNKLDVEEIDYNV